MWWPDWWSGWQSSFGVQSVVRSVATEVRSVVRSHRVIIDVLDGSSMDHGEVPNILARISLYVDDGCLEHIIQILKPASRMRRWILGMHDACECL